MAGEETRERILNAAEKLFSENGFSATSVRAITASAGVNLAALNYHFGSKDSVIDSVFERRIGPLNRERLRLLDQLENSVNNSEPTLEQVLRAFLEPAIRLGTDPDSGAKQFMKLMGKAHSESGEFFTQKIARKFIEVFNRFSLAIRKTLPELPEEELIWRFHFLIGAMAHTMAHTLSIRELQILRNEGLNISGQLSPQAVSGEDAESVITRLVKFAAAGLRAETTLHSEERQH